MICLDTVRSRSSSQPTYLTTQEVHARPHPDQSVSDQSSFGTVHVLGALVQVLDHTGDPTDPDLTVEPLRVGWKPQSRLSLIKAHFFHLFKSQNYGGIFDLPITSCRSSSHSPACSRCSGSSCSFLTLATPGANQRGWGGA